MKRKTPASLAIEEIVRLRAEVKRLRDGIERLRGYAKERDFIIYNEGIVRTCYELLGEKEGQDGQARQPSL